MIRCSDASRVRGEPLAATASVVDAYLLVSDPGPWGPAILTGSRLPVAVREQLAGLQRDARVRPLLIRRPGRTDAGPRTLFAVNARHGWAQTIEVDSLDEVADLDFTGLTGEQGLGWTPHADPLLLVCTHGRHDPCCAVRGRPLAAALAERYPDLVWEVSHIGGDRFAGNLLALPRGDYFGRLEPETAPAVVDAYLAGELDLDHHRGRSTQRWAVQAAESEARRRFGVARFDDVEVLTAVRADRFFLVSLRVRGQAVTAHVRVGSAAPVALTCHSTAVDSAPAYQVELRIGGSGLGTAD